MKTVQNTALIVFGIIVIFSGCSIIEDLTCDNDPDVYSDVYSSEAMALGCWSMMCMVVGANDTVTEEEFASILQTCADEIPEMPDCRSLDDCAFADCWADVELTKQGCGNFPDSCVDVATCAAPDDETGNYASSDQDSERGKWLQQTVSDLPLNLSVLSKGVCE